MKVYQAYLTLGKLVKDGHMNKELIFRDNRSGDTGSISVSSDVVTIEKQEEMGRLCDEEIGYEYVPVYCDH